MPPKQLTRNIHRHRGSPEYPAWRAVSGVRDQQPPQTPAILWIAQCKQQELRQGSREHVVVEVRELAAKPFISAVKTVANLVCRHFQAVMDCLHRILDENSDEFLFIAAFFVLTRLFNESLSSDPSVHVWRTDFEASTNNLDVSDFLLSREQGENLPQRRREKPDAKDLLA
jgi:hypothetical protein